jgi:hypothetical protein
MDNPIRNLDQLMARCAPIPFSGCWIWMGSLRDGYGQINDGIKPRSAHRRAHLLASGAIDAGLMVLHRCDVPECCNPTHLYQGSAKQNAHDALQRGRWKAGWQNKEKTNCVHGHLLSPENTYTTPLGFRECKQCRRDKSRRYLGKNRPLSFQPQ